MDLGRPLSPLELTVLGVVSKRQPCSGYAVMSEFVESSTTAYRSGAGSIYPLLGRMVRAGLLSSEPAGKRLRHYRITEAGVEAMRRWMIEELGRDDFSCSLDALRSRTYFLRVLTADEREEYFERAQAGLEGLLARCLEQLAGYERLGDPFSLLAMEGAVAETEARLAWIKRCRERSRNL